MESKAAPSGMRVGTFSRFRKECTLRIIPNNGGNIGIVLAAPDQQFD
jgi:hypothetical protein